MINSIQSGMPMPPPANGRSAQSLTDEQQQFITDTLSQFDPEQLTESDAKSIVEAFAEAGIQPGAALEKSLSEAGFDAQSLGDLAGVGQRQGPPPPPKQSNEQISELVDYLSQAISDALSANESNNLSDEDKLQILAKAQEKFGLQQGSSVINTHA
jgi:hypothetical protein